MYIECTTKSAADRVVRALIDAQLWPGQEFHINDPYQPDPPVRLTVHVNLPTHIVRQLEDMTDIIITNARDAVVEQD
jgi:hypothetical protein